MQWSNAILDLKVVRFEKECIFKHFIKSTQTTRTIHYTSAHPQSVKVAILNGEIQRSFDHCSRSRDRNIEGYRIKDKFQQNGYPDDVVERAINKWRPPKDRKSKPKLDMLAWVPLPYIFGIYELVSKKLKSSGIGSYCPPTNQIRDLLSNGWANFGLKKVDNIFRELGCVYAVPCCQCRMLYIGQTGRLLVDRIAEHQRAVRSNDTNNAIARHATEHGHVPDL